MLRQRLAARLRPHPLHALPHGALVRRPLGRQDAAGSLAKLSWARCDQELAELAVDLIGLDALLAATTAGPLNLLGVRQASIAGGTTEINKTVVGERVLGLPR